MPKLTLINTLIAFGVLLVLSGVGSTSSGGEDTPFAFIGGTLFLLGALACHAREKQPHGDRDKWIRWELIALTVVGIVTALGFIQGLWYSHPVSFLIAPVIVWGSWFYTLRLKSKSISKKD